MSHLPLSHQRRRAIPCKYLSSITGCLRNDCIYSHDFPILPFKLLLLDVVEINGNGTTVTHYYTKDGYNFVDKKRYLTRGLLMSLYARTSRYGVRYGLDRVNKIEELWAYVLRLPHILFVIGQLPLNHDVRRLIKSMMKVVPVKLTIQVTVT